MGSTDIRETLFEVRRLQMPDSHGCSCQRTLQGAHSEAACPFFSQGCKFYVALEGLPEEDVVQQVKHYIGRPRLLRPVCAAASSAG